MSQDNQDPTVSDDAKPKRNRRPVKKKKTTAQAPADAKRADEASDFVGEVKPKKKTRTRKKSSTKKSTTKKAPAKTPVNAEAAAQAYGNTVAPVVATKADADGNANTTPDRPRHEQDKPDGYGNGNPNTRAQANPDQPDASNDDNGDKPKRRRRSRRRGKGKGNNPNPNGGGANPTNGGGGGGGQPNPQGNNRPAPQPAEPLETVTGIYEQGPKSDGRLRQLDNTLLAYPRDPVVASHLVERYGLRPGIQIECTLGKTFGGGQQGQQYGRGKKQKKEKYFSIDPQARRVQDIVKIEGEDPTNYNKTRRFEDLTSVMPEPRLTLEYPGCPPACRLIDLFCPIGFGTRGMIVSPPKAGKTTLLQNIAMSIRHNYPEIEVFALLIDERPEEVTDFRRNVPCTVWASSNDHTAEKHCALAIAAIERCKRLAELGQNVVVLMDSLTRLGRAFNNAPGIASTGRTMSGGLDSGALTIPKQLFGAARRFDEGGSLTIVATALVDTGSRGDQVIFEEFKGTGNMELILDRKIAEQRLFPAIDLAASGTRNEDKLMADVELQTVNALRRRLLNMQPVMQIDQLLKALQRFDTNEDLVGNPQSPGSDAATAR